MNVIMAAVNGIPKPTKIIIVIENILLICEYIISPSNKLTNKIIPLTAAPTTDEINNETKTAVLLIGLWFLLGDFNVLPENQNQS
jgi:hypothetical protein